MENGWIQTSLRLIRLRFRRRSGRSGRNKAKKQTTKKKKKRMEDVQSDALEIATHPVPWESVCVEPGLMPKGWGECIPNRNIIQLKDTGSGYYKNVFIDSVSYKYMLPFNSSHPVSVRILSPRKNTSDLKIHLFKVQHGKDHFLGEYVVYSRHVKGTGPSAESTHVILKRLLHQTKNLYTTSTMATHKKRSRSEAMHEVVIRSLFPAHGIVHEPECSSGLQRPCVIGGIHQSWASEFYTVDYVTYDLQRGIRICWESKFDFSSVDGVAIEKCRALRDKGYHRVVAIAGHGDDTILYDFAWSNESESSYDMKYPEAVSAFRARFAFQ